MSGTPTIAFAGADDDRWPLAAEDSVVAPSPALLLRWSQWLAVRDTWPHGSLASVALPNDLDVREVVPDLARLARIALLFPKWTDGRAYSQARLLRTRHRFTGELRAIGDVIADMAMQLERTGFDTALLRPGESVAVAERMLGLFPSFYQGDAHEPQLHFSRDGVSRLPQPLAQRHDEAA